MNDERRPARNAVANSASENDTGSAGRPADRRRQVTPLQNWLITFYLLLEDAREELDHEAWRAFVWIAADRVGIEAAQVVVAEALEAAEEAA
jgi:hypothetical protein